MEKETYASCITPSNMEYSDAYQTLLNTFASKRDAGDVARFLDSSCYKPVEEFFRSNYERNVSALRKYPYIFKRDFPGFTDLANVFIPGDVSCDYKKNRFAIYKKSSCSISSPVGFALFPPAEFPDITGMAGLLNEIYDPEFLEWVLKRSYENIILSAKVPCYSFYEDFEEFCSMLQLFDYSEILACERVVFLFGKEQAEEILIDPQAWPPHFFLSSPSVAQSYASGLIDKIIEARISRTRNKQTLLEEYYKNLTPQRIADRIKDKKARISFVTTRFSTAMQYFARDSVTALKTLGYDAELLIEKNDLCFVTDEVLHNHFAEFKPDIVVWINYLRNHTVPKNAVYVCWIQDFMSNLMSMDAAASVGALDFVLNQFSESREFKVFGYPEKRIVYAPIPVDDKIYRTYDLTQEEDEIYSTDICIISNSGDIEEAFAAFINKFESHPARDLVHKVFRTVKERIFDDVYRERADYYDYKQLFDLCNREFSSVGIDLCYDEFKKTFHEFKTGVIAYIYKVVPLLWLHERGYRMKIWGRAWPSHPILKKYAMGVAKNGETMSRILNASKISLGMNIAVTLHPRLFESTLSGSLYLANNVPAGLDWTDARNFLTENEEFMIFYNKKDLFDKIDRILGDERERLRIVENGANRIRENYTSLHVMEKLMTTMAERLAKAK